MDGMPVKEGDVVAGKYRVERVLGSGGMGVVVAATHLELLEPVALKFILPSALTSADAATRFLREARAAARLKSEHVARVHDTGRLESGALYMVMDYLEGSDLDVILKRNGPLPETIAALYAIQACQALAEAHSLGIVHRDIKPSNLFLTRRADGTACIKVLDFGISKMTGTGADFEMTKTDAVLGSPSYMSPEQMRSSRSADARSDIWSLGVILYKLVTGKLPFRAETITELITMVLEAAPAPPGGLQRGVSPAFDAIVLRCMRRSRDERYPNVAALAAELAPLAPPGARTSVESMSRILASVPPIAGVASDIPAPFPSAPSTEGRTSASALNPEIQASSGPSLPPPPLRRSAELTGSSWGSTLFRARGRRGTSLLLGGVGTGVGLAIGLGVALLRDRPSPLVAPGTPAMMLPAMPSKEAAAAPSTAPSLSPLPPSVAPSAELSSSPVSSSGGHPGARKRPAPSAGKLAASAAASASAVPEEEAPSILVDPWAKRPPSSQGTRSGDVVDPFGSGRK